MARLSLGIDCGSTTTKGALFDGETVVKTILLPTAARPRERMGQIYDALYSPEVEYVVTTGYGRELLPQAHKRVTEITCHAKGAAYLCPGISGVVDIGGQDSKAILLDRDGNVADFVMNDKCAAGTGRFVEMMGRILDCPLDEIDAFTKDAKPVDITSMCTVLRSSACWPKAGHEAISPWESSVPSASAPLCLPKSCGRRGIYSSAAAWPASKCSAKHWKAISTGLCTPIPVPKWPAPSALPSSAGKKSDKTFCPRRPRRLGHFSFFKSLFAFLSTGVIHRVLITPVYNFL